MRISDGSSDVCSSDLIGVGAKRVPRADPRQRQVEKEAIQIGIIERVTAQDQRHMRIETLGLAALANSNDRHRRETVPPDPPPRSRPHPPPPYGPAAPRVASPPSWGFAAVPLITPLRSRSAPPSQRILGQRRLSTAHDHSLRPPPIPTPSL